MARQSQVSVENNFTKGLITEATAMAFPENAVVDTDNCDYSNRGVVTRRLGIDFEESATILPLSDFTTNTILTAAVEFVWDTVSNSGSTTFLVQQIGETVAFFLNNGSSALSDNKKSFEVDLTTYKVLAYSTAQVARTPASFAAGAGFLYITHPLCEPLLVDYDVDTDTITVTEIDIQVRDMGGVDDGLAVDERTDINIPEHVYNLYNQGWDNETGVAGVGVTHVLTAWNTYGPTSDLFEYPSNSDVFWQYRDVNGDFNLERVNDFWVGNSPAPRGHFVFNAFNIDRNSKVATVANKTTNARPSSVSFYAGRVWYSGVQDKEYGSKIYFSKIITSTNDVGKCHQANDPTSEVAYDIVADDGGEIVIAQAGNIKTIVTANNYLIVLADNGVWVVSGSDNSPFTSTNYSVTRLSDIGVVGSSGIISVEGVPVWISTDGFYTIQIGEVSQMPQVVSVTRETIQTVFDSIPKDLLVYMKGAFNQRSKRLIWLYNDTVAGYIYNKAIVLDRTSGAFYKYSFVGVPDVIGIVSVNGLDEEGRTGFVFKIVTGGPIGGSIGSPSNGITYSQFVDTNHTDWASSIYGPTTFVSTFTTGYRVRGELLKKFQSNYLMVLTGDEVGGHCLVQGIWDYSNTTGNGRYTSSQDVYRPDSTYNYHRAKVKIRGNGYSLQFKFTSLGNSPFSIIGWSTYESANSIP